jgi:endonuclease YncB( thermonuclease family)
MDRPDHLGEPIGKFSLMRPAALATGLAGIATVGVLLAVGAASVEKPPAMGSAGIFARAETKDKAAPAAIATIAADATLATATTPNGSKPKTPSGNQADSMPTVPDPPAASAPAPAPAEAKPAELKPVDIARPVADSAGVLIIAGKKLQLAGITPTDPNRTCTGPNGKEWPCGTVARTALRAFLRSRAITCDLPDGDWQGTVTGNCRFVKTDLSEWLARNGWAEAEAGSPLAAAADEARKNNRGIYGDDPRKDRPSTLAPAPAREDPLNPI